MKKITLLSFIILVWVGQLAIAQKRETRTFSTFTKVSFRVPGKLFIKQGATQKVELEGDAEVLSKIETEVSGNKLTIGQENKRFSWGDDKKIIVYITVKDLDGLYLGGSGDVMTENTFNTRDIEIKVSGSGSLKVSIKASGNMEADISGSGNMEITGSCTRFDSHVGGSGKTTLSISVYKEASFGISGSGRINATGSSSKVKASISGSGKLLAADFVTNVCDVHISGSGDVEINVKDEIDASISGSGNVSYKGSPQHVKSHSSGSGKVRKM